MKSYEGDRVKWTSQSGGYVKEKEGHVVAVVPSQTRAERCLPEGFFCNSKSGYGQSRDHESYLVRVGNSKKLYWPIVRYLRRIK